MKTIILILTVGAALCGVSLTAKEATTSGVSPSRAIAWSVDPDSGGLYLVYAGGGGDDVKLCNVTSTANLGVHFSPDDKYVFVTDGTASSGIHVSLYRRSSGLKYSKVDFDFDLAVQKLAMEAETGTIIKSEVLDHSYLKCLGWARNGTAILQLSGTGRIGGKRIEISGFQCVYDPVGRSFAAKGR